MRFTNRHLGIIIILVSTFLFLWVIFSHNYPKSFWEYSVIDYLFQILLWASKIAGVIGILLIPITAIVLAFEPENSFEIKIPIPGTKVAKIVKMEKEIEKAQKIIQESRSEDMTLEQYQFRRNAASEMILMLRREINELENG